MKARARITEDTEVVLARELYSQLSSWLLDAAYPLWSTRGIDPVHGGFQERLTLTGTPTSDARRSRVQPRQIYAFSRAPVLGWKGDAAGAIAHGLSYFLTHYRRPDGLFRTLVAPDGAIRDDRALTYDQAFALLGLASAVPLLDASFHVRGEGEQLRQALYRHLKRAGAGFESGLPHGAPLLSNPHMHLLESALAWLDVGGGEEWSAIADDAAHLALSHLIDPHTGMLHERFDSDWQPTSDAAGRVFEPGHMFEWAWLLLRWGPHSAMARDAAGLLIDVAETHGVRAGVVMNVISEDPSVHDGSARLWPQTERLRVAALGARLYGDMRYWRMAASSASTLLRYLATDVPGLWYDRLMPSGEFVRETVTAGNLYHIVGAIDELATLVRSQGPARI